MANDKTLHDVAGNYDIKNGLEKYEANYGSVDIVVLWPTYPQLGFDDRRFQGCCLHLVFILLFQVERDGSGQGFSHSLKMFGECRKAS